MKHVVNFSGGLCSFWAAHRVAQQHGPKDVTLLFADTLVESEELYLFNRKCSALLGVPITRLCYGLTPWQLFRKEGLIGNSRFPICSVRLKRELLDQWHREFCLEMDTVLYLGFDWTEGHRLKDLREELPTWQVEAPMTEEPIWDKCRMIAEAEAIGLPISSAYVLGLPHDNCGGGCVRAGISHWVRVYHVRPVTFANWEREEQETMADFRVRGITPLTMLKDRRGGTSKNLSLLDLRKRIEAGEKFPSDEWGGCGCGGATYANQQVASV